MTSLRRAAAALMSAGLLALMPAGPRPAVLAQPPATPRPEPAAADRPALKDGAARADLYGDPLPDGAIARLGTVRFSTPNGLRDVNFTPDGKLLVGVGGEGTFLFWDARTGKEIRSLVIPIEAGPYEPSFSFSPDGKLLAGISSGGVYICDLAAGKPPVRLEGDYSWCQTAFSPDGKMLAMSGKGLFTKVNDASLWDAATGKELHDLGEADSPVAYSPTGEVVATCRGASLFLWDPATGKRRLEIATQQKKSSALAFAPDGKTLASAGTDQIIVFWDPETGKQIRRLKGHDARVSFLRFTADGKTLVSRGGSAAIVWDVKSGEQLRSVKKLPTELWDWNGPVDLAPDGETFVAGDDGHARLWDLSSGQERPTGPFAVCRAILFSPDGKTVVTGGMSSYSAHGWVLQTWDAASGKLLKYWDSDHFPSKIAFSPDGEVLASAGWSWATTLKAGVQFWDAATGRRLAQTEDTFSNFESLNFAPDGKTVTVVNDDGVFIIDAKTGKASRAVGQDKLEREEQFAYAVKDRQGGVPLLLRETATGKEQFLSPPIEGPVLATALSRDGSLLALSGPRHVVYVVETASGKTVKQFRSRWEWVDAVVFSPDGATLASADADSTVLLWDLSGRGRQAPGNLSRKELDKLLDDLRGEDAGRAFVARQILTAAPKQAAPLLLAGLKAATPPPSPQRLAKLIADLEADDFQAREDASAELAKLGTTAEAALRKVRDADPSPESAHRLDELLKQLEDAKRAERIRLARAIAVLENANAPEARQALEELVKGAASVAATEEAKVAIARLARLPTAP